MGLLDGHRAAITGGASGIGRATARRMAAEGASVAVLDVDGAAARTSRARSAATPTRWT
jgi:NAD(P)-dependent dehydrogenase (short-subunit alcohol dehydrogenase family)